MQNWYSTDHAPSSFRALTTASLAGFPVFLVMSRQVRGLVTEVGSGCGESVVERRLEKSFRIFAFGSLLVLVSFPTSTAGTRRRGGRRKCGEGGKERIYGEAETLTKKERPNSQGCLCMFPCLPVSHNYTLRKDFLTFLLLILCLSFSLAFLSFLTSSSSSSSSLYGYVQLHLLQEGSLV